MKLGTWLFSLLRPATGRIFSAIGLSVVSITGMDLIFTQLKASLTVGVNALPSNLLNVFLIAGGGQALGIIIGALTTRLLLWQIANSTRILGVNPQ